MPHKSIRYTMNNLIIYPLIVSFLIIAATISFSLFAVDNQRVEKIKSNSYDFHKYYLRDLARVIGFSFQNYTMDILNDLAAFNSVLQSGYNGKITLVSSITPTATPSYYVNALNLAFEGIDGIGITIPGYDSDTGVSVYRPMWYIDRDTVDLTTVSDFEDSYENYLLGMSMIFSMYNSGKYEEIYSVTRERATTARKLYSTYPLDIDFSDFVMTLESGPWWDLALDNFTDNTSVSLVDPYYIEDRGYVYTACMPIYFSDSFYADISVNCVNYDVQLLLDSLENIDEVDDMNYFVVDQNSYNVIMHTNLANVTSDGEVVNITQVEFGLLNTSTSDAMNYTAKFIALSTSLSSDNYYMEYTQNDETYVLVLIQVLVTLGNGDTAPYLIGVTQPKDFIYDYFSSLGDDVVEHARIQLIGVSSIMVLLVLFYLVIGARIERSMTRSIKDLIKFGETIDNYWNTETKDSVSFVDQTTLSFDPLTSQKISKSFRSSKEVQLVHDYFMQVMGMVQCTREAQHASTDAEALTGYSQALKIYEKINHTKGLSIAYSNIARLHHQNNRLEEAIVNYQRAIVMTRQEIEKLHKVSNEWKLEQFNVKKGGFLRKKAHQPPGDLNEYGIASSLTQMQKDMKLELAERFYEFGQCLIQFGKKSKGANKTSSLEKIVAVFSEVIRYDKELKEKPERIIICMLTVSNVYIEQNELNAAVAKLDVIEDYLKDYKVDYERRNKDNQHVLFIPPGIFRQNLMFQRALYYRKLGLTHEAFKVLTETLELETRFDPNIRRRCLLEIKSILEQANLIDLTPSVNMLLESYKNKGKDIIVLLDCSQSMGQGARLRLLIKNILRMFDNFLRPTDRMGYITFHLNCDIVFSLTEKKMNTNQTRKLLEAMPRPSGGTALYSAIYEAIKLLVKAEPKNHSKWIIALTDGDDGDSRITFEQIYRRLARSDTNLLIMGLALHQSVSPKMNYLCKSTKGGVFVESQSEDKIDEAFNMITSIVYGQEFESEEITFEI